MIDHTFRFVTLFWPKKVKASKLEEIHAKMVMKESTPRVQSTDSNVVKKPRVAGKTNGSSSTPSSSHRTNGKSFR
jgi:chromodomain-helicase-DNA-binding protein 1